MSHLARLLGFVAVAAALLSPALVSAQDQQGFALSRYRPAPGAQDGLGLQLPDTPGPWAFSGKLVVDYSHNPLVLSQATGDMRDEIGPIVRHALVTHLALSLGLGDTFSSWLSLPFTVVQRGAEPVAMGFDASSAEGGAVGDLAVGASALLVGENEPPGEDFDTPVGLAAELLLPTGSQDKLAGDGNLGFRSRLLLSFASSGWTPIANLGYTYRPKRDYVSAELRSELTFGLGAHIPAGDTIRIEGEVRGSTTYKDFFGDTSTAVELLAGAQFGLGDEVLVGLGAGVGLSGGVGVPDFRGLLSFGYAMSDDDGTEEAEPEDSDGDGVPDEDDDCPDESGDGEDGCPEVEGPTDDRDSDGVKDDDDFCPDESETENMFQDEDGCPDGVERTDTHFVVTPALLFDSGATELSGEVELLLGILAEAINSAQNVELVQIEGHASRDEGNERRTLRIAERRAEAVMRWLVEVGDVQEGRMTAVGIGADQPVDEDEQAENRRVEIRIVNF